MNKMKIELAVLLFVMMTGLASAITINIQPTASFNSGTNTLTLTVPTFNAFNVLPNTTVNFAFSMTVITNVTSADGNSFVYNTLLSSSTITALAANIPAQAKVNKVFTCINGAVFPTNTFFNLSVICPPTANITRVFTPANYIQSNIITPVNGVAVNVIVGAFPKINKNEALGYSGNYFNSTYNLTCTSPAANKWNVNALITPSWTSNMMVSNTAVNAVITVNQIPLLDINTQVTAPQHYYNTTYGVLVQCSLPQINKKLNLSFNDTWNYAAMNLSVHAPALPYAANVEADLINDTAKIALLSNNNYQNYSALTYCNSGQKLADEWSQTIGTIFQYAATAFVIVTGLFLYFRNQQRAGK